MIIYDDSGRRLDAHFSVHAQQRGTAVIFESRGGVKGSSRSRNHDYNPALELVLERLGRLDLRLIDAYVDSAVVQAMPLSQRRLIGDRLPLRLRGLNHRDLRLELTRAQRPVGRISGARGAGNRTRRLALVVTPTLDPDALASHLSTGFGGGLGAEAEHGLRSIGSGGGQGFSLEIAARLVVECHAVDWAARHYRDLGWKVEDVGDRESFDLCCSRRESVMHVEVKGTTSSGESIMLTRNEVRHAQTFPSVALFIVYGIALERNSNGEWSASGGASRVFDPWELDGRRLTPVTFRYQLD